MESSIGGIFSEEAPRARVSCSTGVRGRGVSGLMWGKFHVGNMNILGAERGGGRLVRVFQSEIWGEAGACERAGLRK